MERLKTWAKKLGIGQDKVVPLILSLGFTLIFVLASELFGGIVLSGMWLITLTGIAFILATVMVVAGSVVLRALFLISAELSLMIFLAQEYCEAAPTPEGNNALKALLVMSMFYMLYVLIKGIFDGIETIFNKLDKGKWPWEKVVIAVLLFLFLALFLNAIYQVIHPIIANLCVFQAEIPGVLGAS